MERQARSGQTVLTEMRFSRLTLSKPESTALLIAPRVLLASRLIPRAGLLILVADGRARFLL